MDERKAILATLTDRAAVFRRVRSGAGYDTEQVYTDLPCALSRNYQGGRPRLTGEMEGVAESGFFLMLYLPAGTALLAGDRAEVLREGVKYAGICSAAMQYPSYAVASMEVQEVIPL
ncbi:MAG: hypothetical protein IJT76_06000 [Clostridia bacterium]|nr:hypothetical protein [Clostridia bacterium]